MDPGFFPLVFDSVAVSFIIDHFQIYRIHGEFFFFFYLKDDYFLSSRVRKIAHVLSNVRQLHRYHYTTKYGLAGKTKLFRSTPKWECSQQLMSTHASLSKRRELLTQPHQDTCKVKTQVITLDKECVNRTQVHTNCRAKQALTLELNAKILTGHGLFGCILVCIMYLSYVHILESIRKNLWTLYERK